MEQRKKPSADIARYRFLIWNIALITSLLLVISAFEYRFYDSGAVIDDEDITGPAEILTEVKPTVHKPPKPRVVQPEIIEVKIEVPKTEEIEVIFDPTEIDLPEVEELFTPPPVEETQDIRDFAQVQPSPAGGYDAFNRYLSKNLRYPLKARQAGIQGKVYLVFVVDTDGSIIDVEVLKGIGGGCDEEAVRVLEQSPKWNPGQQGRKTVKVRMRLPVVFKLDKN